MCVNGQCAYIPVNCDDGDACTIDSCDPTTGDCVNEPKDCDDGDPCTIDSCDPATGNCLNEPKDCDDSNPCTLDFCNPQTGQCEHNLVDLKVECPEDMSVCVNGDAVTLSGATPAGGDYDGPGVTGGVFIPENAGVGAHTLTYTYVDENGCEASCEFIITVNPVPEVQCPPDMIVCIDAAPVELTGGLPEGGSYSGDGVVGGIFSPAAAGAAVPCDYLHVYQRGRMCEFLRIRHYRGGLRRR